MVSDMGGITVGDLYLNTCKYIPLYSAYPTELEPFICTTTSATQQACMIIMCSNAMLPESNTMLGRLL